MSRQWALEGDPGTCRASFPAWDSLEDAEHQANAPFMTARGQKPPRILTRSNVGQPWIEVA